MNKIFATTKNETKDYLFLTWKNETNTRRRWWGSSSSLPYELLEGKKYHLSVCECGRLFFFSIVLMPITSFRSSCPTLINSIDYLVIIWSLLMAIFTGLSSSFFFNFIQSNLCQTITMKKERKTFWSKYSNSFDSII